MHTLLGIIYQRTFSYILISFNYIHWCTCGFIAYQAEDSKPGREAFVSTLRSLMLLVLRSVCASRAGGLRPRWYISTDSFLAKYAQDLKTLWPWVGKWLKSHDEEPWALLSFQPRERTTRTKTLSWGCVALLVTFKSSDSTEHILVSIMYYTSACINHHIPAQVVSHYFREPA
ncbi:hypothetical protein B0H63DRAFT_57386 [Podospora didyma]|uniref:Uncharacterized protein n=1 Tax=Podospora didyma TaxID=330526 RepID=A0AAE0P7H0_9PEZI|nr:hypothetical protein B0H63DRAFT_57386 [Podospora didyma]